MRQTAVRALIVNDIRLYRTDRRAMIIGVMVPILIAAFFGYVFGGNGGGESTGKIPLALVDEDQSVVSRAIAADLAAQSLVSVQNLSRIQAQNGVRAGKLQVAAIIPRNFSAAAARALFTDAGKPEVELLIDPTQSLSGRIVEGLIAQYGMQEITKEAFNGQSSQQLLAEFIERLDRGSPAELAQRAELRSLLEAARNFNARTESDGSAPANARRGLSIPYVVATTKVTAAEAVPYNGYAHSFAGMTTQFILFAGIDAGIVLLLARERGIWQRIRSAPLTKTEFLLARTLSTTLIGLFQITVIYLFAMAVFGVRIQGSGIGFAAIALALCLMNAAFGLMLASIGRRAAATRGIAMLVTLLLVMIGGAWVPSFVFPKWLQQVSLAAPTRWAVDGLDAVTWRGLGIDAAVMPVAVLGATAIICLAIAIWRFRWEE